MGWMTTVNIYIFPRFESDFYLALGDPDSPIQHAHEHGYDPSMVHQHAHHDHTHDHGPQHSKARYKPTDFDIDKLISTLKQFVRDWSEEVSWEVY
jgi:hypothetical protein